VPSTPIAIQCARAFLIVRYHARHHLRGVESHRVVAARSTHTQDEGTRCDCDAYHTKLYE